MVEISQTPPRTGARIAALDVIRGIAIFGTFATNVWIFAEPGGAAAFFTAGFAPSGPLETGLRAVANGKFLALLTLLFGIGLALQFESARRRGTVWPGRYPLRAGILVLEGFLHYLLIFEFDVLMGYGVASLVVAYLLGRSAAVRRRWMSAVGAVYVLAVGVLTALLVLAPDVDSVPVSAPSTASWPDQVLTRVVAFPLFRIELVLIVPSAVVLFLLGGWLLRAGVFTVDGGELRARLMRYGFGVGVPAHVATTLAGPDWFLVERYLLGPLIAVGLLALITDGVLRVRRAGVAQRGVAAVGRTALSCYVLQNLLACLLCYDWGFGLNVRLGELGPLWPVGLWLVVCLADVAFAVLWLRRFDRGPLESVAARLTSQSNMCA